jgi:hypothetical protein
MQIMDSFHLGIFALPMIGCMATQFGWRVGAVGLFLSPEKQVVTITPGGGSKSPVWQKLPPEIRHFRVARFMSHKVINLT